MGTPYSYPVFVLSAAKSVQRVIIRAAYVTSLSSRRRTKWWARLAGFSQPFVLWAESPNPRQRVAVKSAKNHKSQRRKRHSVTAKREKSQKPKVLTAIRTLPNLTWPNLTYTNCGVCDFSRLAVKDWRLRRWRLWFLALSNAPLSTTTGHY